MWYHKTIGGGRCPIVDTWWQTETGAIMITPLPGAIPTKPGSATLPFFGVDAAVVDERGEEVGAKCGREIDHPKTVAVDVAHDLRRQGTLSKTVLERIQRMLFHWGRRAAGSRTDIFGSLAGLTTCSMSPDIGSAPPKSKARWSHTRKWRKRQW